MMRVGRNAFGLAVFIADVAAMKLGFLLISAHVDLHFPASFDWLGGCPTFWSASGTARVGLSMAALGVLGYGVFSPRSRLLAPLIWRGQRGKSGQVALTFDDGPHPESTPAILDILAEHNVPAAFFVIGVNAWDHAEILQQMHTQGHLIANHSYDHDYIGMFGVYDYWVKQIDRTNSVIETVIGQRPAIFRPPMGFKHNRMAKAARDCKCSMVTWSRRAWDGLPTTPDRILYHLDHRCQDGDIILLHAGAQPNGTRDPITTVESLGSLIQSIRSSGLELVRLDELVGIQPYLKKAN